MRTMNGLSKSTWTCRTAVFPAAAGALALLLGAAIITPPARAQKTGGTDAAKAQQMIKSRAEMQAKNLGLSPNQTQQLIQINTKALQQLKALAAKPPATEMETAKALKAIADQRKASLHLFLTPAQLHKLVATNQKDIASEMTLPLSSTMDLTDDQIKQIDKANLTYIKKAGSALNMSDKTQAAEAFKMAHKAHDSAIHKSLTPDQWKQYQAM